MAKEKNIDYFIANLLKDADIPFKANESGIKEIDDALKSASKKLTGNSGYPEFIAKINDFILVIEDKRDTTKQANYNDENNSILNEDKNSIINYAENGALHYAKHIIKNTNFKKIFAFGCSGDEKHHTIRPIFVDENGYKILEKIENYENFNGKNIIKYYDEIVLEKEPDELLKQKDLLEKAKKLHDYLRDYGQLRETENPLVVSAILLALSESDFKVSNLTGDSINTDGNKIFNAIETYLKRVKVQPDVKKELILNQFSFIKTNTSLNKINPNLSKTPLKFFTEFLYGDIYNTIKQYSPDDILGRFYGQFIKYSGGDGQSLGIVLTPIHITDLFCELIELKPNDIVFDPCCGTGTFLISAMNHMVKQVKNDSEIDEIKKNRLFGMEFREDMFSIATTNMILRGDGKSNLIRDDFLDYDINELKKFNFSVGLINPPYSQAKSKDTYHLSEISFVKKLLDSLDVNGRCVVIVPQSTMVGKTKEDKAIKKQILERHTLEGVITLNTETFYRIGTNPCIAVFKAHRKHLKDDRVKFINFADDGYITKKNSGLDPTPRSVERKKLLIDCWFDKIDAESKFMVKTTIEPEDEWLHSFYYFNDEIPKEEEFDKTISDYLTFEFNMIMQGREYLFEDII